MDNRDHVVFSAFLHDIGKLYERAERLSDYSKDPEKQQLYCPLHKEKNYYSHKHVLYTLAFCEKLLKKFPILDKKYSPDADNNWLNMAARHHKDSQTTEEHIVQLSDRLASGEREGATIYERDIHKKTLLEPLLEKVDLSSAKPEKTSYRIPLRALDSDCENIFPKKGLDELKLNPENLLSEQNLTKEYQKLAEDLLTSIQSLPEYEKNDFENLRTLMQSLLYLCERFLVHVPSATNVASPDISLFDHLKVTSAIAESLYLYHKNCDRLKLDDIKTKENKFLLIVGDFSGIQKFIYNIVSQGAAKSLAGRSLYIQLFCSAVSERILRNLKLYPNSCIYSSGGKFYLLIPIHLKELLLEQIDQVNQILFKKYEGDIYLSIGLTPMNQEDFGFKEFKAGQKNSPSGSEKISQKFKEVHEDLEKNKNQKFLTQIKKQPEQFFSPTDFKGTACSICAKDYNPSHSKESESLDSICPTCKNFEKLGKQIREIIDESSPNSSQTKNSEQANNNRNSGLLWLWCAEDYQNIKKTFVRKYPDKDFDKMCFDFFTTEDDKSKEDNFPKVLIVKDLQEIKNISFKNSHFEFVNQLSNPEPIKGLSFSYRFISSCGELNLDEMAQEQATGIKRIGILRMDVDNLGQVFIEGLKKPTKTTEQKLYGSLSRQASLSRQINTFFTGYLNQLVKNQFQNCKIIYAGGDDLFIIGPWDKLPGLAHTISNQFKKYSCHNPCLSLSAGIALIREKEPVLVGAELAKTAEDQAKNFVRQDSQKKNALCFLDRVIGWEEYQQVKDFKEVLEKVLDETDSKALLQVLYSIEREENLNLSKEDEKVYKAWRHRFVYYIARLLERNKDPKTKDMINQLKDCILNESDQENQYKRLLKYLYMPVCWVDYLNREKQELKKTG